MSCQLTDEVQPRQSTVACEHALDAVTTATGLSAKRYLDVSLAHGEHRLARAIYRLAPHHALDIESADRT